MRSVAHWPLGNMCARYAFRCLLETNVMIEVAKVAESPGCVKNERVLITDD